jgi:hypothetical protein
MSNVLIFSNKNAEAVTDVLTSFGNNWSTSTRAFTDVSPLRDPSALKCIVVCFHEDEINGLDSSCEKLKNFFINNQINPKTPIIPIVYDVESAESYPKNLNTLFNAHDSLNFIKKELVWFKNESSDEFKTKIRWANFTSGYPLAQSSFDADLDLTGKNVDIYAVVKWVFIILGFIVGAIAGGLIGGLAIGGLVAALSGVAIGVVSGPIAGWLTARGIFGGSVAAAEKETENRSNILQQRNEFKERNKEWEIFEESFLYRNSLHPSETKIAEQQESHRPLFRPVNDEKATVLQPLTDETKHGSTPTDFF